MVFLLKPPFSYCKPRFFWWRWCALSGLQHIPARYGHVKRWRSNWGSTPRAARGNGWVWSQLDQFKLGTCYSGCVLSDKQSWFLSPHFKQLNESKMMLKEAHAQTAPPPSTNTMSGAPKWPLKPSDELGDISLFLTNLVITWPGLIASIWACCVQSRSCNSVSMSTGAGNEDKS